MFFRKYEHKVKIGKKSLERKEVFTLLVMGYLPKVDHVTGKLIGVSDNVQNFAVFFFMASLMHIHMNIHMNN